MMDVVQLVETAGAAVDDEHVPVAAGTLAALDLAVRAERVAHIVALVGVGEMHVHTLVAVADDGVRDAVRDRLCAVGRSEVGMQLAARRHVRQPCVAVPVDRQVGDVGTPVVVGREHRATRAGQVPDRRVIGGAGAVGPPRGGGGGGGGPPRRGGGGREGPGGAAAGWGGLIFGRGGGGKQSPPPQAAGGGGGPG